MDGFIPHNHENEAKRIIFSKRIILFIFLFVFHYFQDGLKQGKCTEYEEITMESQVLCFYKLVFISL